MANPVLAVVDIGSNSIKILVASPGRGVPDGPELQVIFQETLETRISGGIGQEHSRLSAKGIESGVNAIEKLLALAASHLPTHVKIVATSAVRDAANRAEFASRVRAITGTDIEILSGDDEALLIARGIRTDPALGGAQAFSIMDLGGGSLECIRYVADKIEQAVSLQLGAVRLTEKYVPNSSGPFTPQARAAIDQETRHVVETSGFHFIPGGKIVGCGGAFSVVRAIVSHRRGITDKNAWPPEIFRRDIEALLYEIAPMSAVERARIERLTPERADIMPAALTTILAMLDIAGVDRIFHSWNNLRFGVASRFFAQLRGEA